MTLKKLAEIAKEILTGKECRRLYALADRKSTNITHHNWKHASRAGKRGLAFAKQIERHFPGTFKPEYLAFHVPVAAFGHDLGRSHGYDTVDGKEVDRTAYWSARVLRDILEKHGVSREDQLPILYACVNHSAGPSRKALRMRGAPPLTADKRLRQLLLSCVVIGDKSDAVRDRVRAPEARVIEKIAGSGKARAAFEKADEDLKNWLANYSIISARVLIDPSDNGGNERYKGSVILQWQLDPRLCTPEQIVSVGWFRKGYHGCENASQNVFQLNFGIEANGKRYFWSKSQKTWICREQPPLPKSA